MKFMPSVSSWLLPLILKAANFLLHFLFNHADIYICHDRIGCPYCDLFEFTSSDKEDLPE